MSSNLSNLSFGFGSNIYKQTNFEKGEENIIIKKPMKVTNVNKIIWANMYSTLGYCSLENLNKPKRFFGNDLYGLIGYVDINGNLYKLDDHKKKCFDVDDGNINNKYNINIIDIDQFWNGDEAIFVTEDGKLWKWNIKNDNLQEILLPFSPSPPLNIIFKKISCGENHCLALTKQGEVYSWGDGRYGQLGHGDFRSLNKPKVIEFFQGLKVTQIACGGLHSAVITGWV
ncbi:7557_t:CDS:2 [Entrophospora sp. SA101]|nr:7557_t:CDS:2 [Entrophospora sp. SA101]